METSKLPIRHIPMPFFLNCFFLKSFTIFFFSLSLTCDPMGAKILKRYFSDSFGPISTKLYDKYISHGGI